jgi:hypothetical protein
VLPGVSTKASPVISVYTCSGELVSRKTVSGNIVNLQRQFGLADDMFVVKVEHKGTSKYSR